MSAEPVLTADHDDVRVITLNRPSARNALGRDLIRATYAALTAADSDESVRAVVLTGADPAFCAGVDLKEAARDGLSYFEEFRSQSCITAVANMRTPVVGAINGATFTGGLEMALGCDFMIASERAVFADTHARVGILPGGGMTARLPQLVGAAMARRLSMTGEVVDAARAERIGLVTEVVAHERLVERAIELASQIAEVPRATMRESPFGFVIIDDPVQALDPAKVEGLARVLAEAASTHQVVVFTHDDRLPEAVRRLEIRATFVDIMRKDRSAVEIRRVKGPVSMLLDDARAIAKTEAMPDAIKLRLVPNFCRSAVEATCHEVVRSRRLLRGEAHADVEDLLVKAGRIRNLMALALFDDVAKAGEVETRLASDRKAAHKATFRACLDGAHGDFTGEPAALVSSTEALVDFVRAKAAKA